MNQKILSLIDSDTADKHGITPEDIYNAYTGDGGLHGLSYADYGNRAAYTAAKREIENGQFFTPAPVCKFIMECLALEKSALWADLTCGMGNFFNFAPSEENAYGCELDVKAFKVAHYLYPKANIKCQDIRAYDPGVKLDYVVGNPPFHLKWWVDNGEVVSQLYYCQKAAEVLKPFGIMAIVVPSSFLADDFTDSGYIKEMENNFSFLGQVSLSTDTFSALGVVEYSTKIQFWQKRADLEGRKAKPYSTICSNFPLTKAGVKAVKDSFLKKAQEELARNRGYILMKLAEDSCSKKDFAYKCRKYLWHIQSNPVISDRYSHCCEYINRYYTQRKPDEMDWETWEKTRLTEAKVLAYLRQTVKRQHKPEYKDEIRQVKYAHSIGYKAYSPKMARQLPDTEKVPIPTYRIISEGEADTIKKDFPHFAKPLLRKRREYECEMKPFREMEQNPAISAWLDAFTLHDADDTEIHLNPLQKRDVNLILQKRNALLQWEQGSGKTLAGIAYGQYRMEKCRTPYVWVVSNAISIKNNWSVVLPNYGIPFSRINRLDDLEKAIPGFVLITINMLVKYRKHIKKFVKSCRTTLVFDESDEMSNPSSKRTKAILDVFRRVQHKLLMTGTSTRNNIAEFAPQLELAYNNSYNMLSLVPKLFMYDKAVGEVVEMENHNYKRPIPAYRPGYRLFAESHLPERITVFGVGQKTQDIYNNADALNEILGHFVITRSFEEVSGKDIKHIHQVPVSFSPPEREVYYRAMEDFESMRNNYYSSTGNSRKDAMMRLIQQIMLLLRISAAPNTVKEYEGGMPIKIQKVLDMLADMHDNIVAIGVRHKIVVEAYASAIKEFFPDRPLFIVTGDTVSLAQRRKLRQTLRDSTNGILLCTQQSLPSSVNFEFVDKCIIPEMHYNNAQMSQFYFRFIRYNSSHAKDVYFVTYVGSIEANQLQMVLAKEKLTLFMKGRDQDLDKIYETFGVNFDLLSTLIRKEQDEHGNFHIRWGEQSIT